MDELTGRVALVTGASRGIGRAAAIALGLAGCEVAVNYRRQRAEAETAASEIIAGGVRAMALQADVSRADEVRQLFAEVREKLGPVSIVVNNAGNSYPKSAISVRRATAVEHSSGEWRR